MKHKTDLVIITNEPFPIGMAATNRILSYAKEISKTKKVYVLIPKPTESIKDIKNKLSSGQIDNLKYEYTNKNTIWPFKGNKLVKIKTFIIGIINLIIRIFQLKPKTIIIYTSNYTLRILLLVLKFFLSFRLIIEENEYPKILNKTNRRFIQNINLRLYRLSDGMLVMTKELKKYYSSLKVNDIFHLPMTVEIERFNDSVGSNKPDDYFLYIGGSGGFNRDGVKNIINGYNFFSKKYPNIKLFIIGPLNKTSPLFVEIDNYIKNKKITEGVVFKGPISSSKIPKYLKKAIGIIMAPQNNFTSGGFPTKLGEFLASGRPVIITNVSEISSYLNNNNSFLIEPGNDFLISEAMEKIISNEEFANKIGNEGQKIAEFHFNVQTYKSNLIEFLKI